MGFAALLERLAATRSTRSLRLEDEAAGRQPRDIGRAGGGSSSLKTYLPQDSIRFFAILY